MASFKSSAVIFTEKATPVSPTNPGDISVVARNGKLYQYDGVIETEIGAGDLNNYTLLSTTSSISGDLNTSINNEVTARINGDINLQNQVTNLASVTGSYALATDLSNYTTLSTTASISGDLKSQIDSITVPTSATFLSDYDARYVNESDLNIQTNQIGFGVATGTISGSSNLTTDGTNLGVGSAHGTSAYVKLGVNSFTKAHINMLPSSSGLTNPIAGDMWMNSAGLNICPAGSATFRVLHATVPTSNDNIIISNGTHNVTNSSDLTYNKTTGLKVTPTAVHTGSRSLVVTPPANNTQTANEEYNDVLFNFSRTATWAAGTISNQRAFAVTAPTYAFASASTIVNAATVAIEGAPIAGTNATLTNRVALWVQADDVWISNGHLKLRTAGKGIFVKEGTNATMGSATLVAGTVTVSTTAVNANSRIFLTSQVDGGTPGFLRVSSRTAGTSFVITSGSATDTSTVAWIIIEPS